MATDNQDPTSPPVSSRDPSPTRTPLSRPMTPCSEGVLGRIGARFDDDSHDRAAPEHGIEVPARVTKRMSAAELFVVPNSSGVDADADRVAGSDTASVHTTRQGAPTVSPRTTTPSSSEAGDGAAAETPMPSSSTMELPNRDKPNPTENKRKASASETDGIAHKKATPTKTRSD